MATHLMLKGLGVAVLVVAGAYYGLLPTCTHTKEGARRLQCEWNAKQLVLALQTYAVDHDDRLPYHSNWTAIVPVSDSTILRCPGDQQKCGYAFNRALSRKRTNDVKDPAETICVFEANSQRSSPYGDPEQLFEPRHDKQVVAFLDGHAVLREIK